MVRNITMNLIVKQMGMKSVENLYTKLRLLNSEVERGGHLTRVGTDINDAHTKVLHKQNTVLQARLQSEHQSITNLAREMNSVEKNTMAWEHKIDVERRALQIRAMMGGELSNYHRYLANEEITIEKNTVAHRENQKAMMMRRREILGSTMAIFGMTMSIWQMTNALSALAGENEDLKKDMKTLQAVMMGATGPLLLIHGIIQLTTMATDRLGVSMRVLLPTMFAIAAAYMALTSHSKELRAIFGALAGMLAVLTAVQIKHLITTKVLTAAKFREAVANIWKMATEYPIIGAAFALAAVGGAALAASTVPSGQTRVGQERAIEETGFFYGHKGETVATISPTRETRGSDEPIVVILELDGEELGRAWANVAEKEDYVR